jgi:uncharacterized protein YkwD
MNKFLFVLAICVPAAAAAASKHGPGPDLASVARRVIEDTNEYRREEGRGKVAPNEKLAAAAREFARFMARTGEYGHAADGREPWARAQSHGYDYCFVSENIAYHYDSRGFDAGRLAQQVFEGWKGSAGHRKNLLQGGVTETGVALARSDKTGYIYAVQMFGLPRSARISFQVRNESGAAARYRLGDRSFDLPPRAVRSHETCASEPLAFERRAARGERAFEPANGDQFVVAAEGEGVSLRRR